MTRNFQWRLRHPSASSSWLALACALVFLAPLKAQFSDFLTLRAQQQSDKDAQATPFSSLLDQPGECADCEATDFPHPAVSGGTRRPPSPNALPESRITKAQRDGSRKAASASRPEPSTEFQNFVTSSTGQRLPVFGAQLFEDVPSTFAPVDGVPVGPDYAVGPSDEIDLRIWGQINFSQRLLVDRTGDVFIPQVGRVSVAGLRYAELHDSLRSAIGRVFKNFDMNVNMGQLRTIQVFVVGQARRPGTYTISSLSTLVNALFVSGGPSSRGSMRRIQLKRDEAVVTTFDLYDLLLRGEKSKDVRLQNGDVIFIPNVGPRVAISGSVETAAIYELKPATPLSELLQYAGGLSPVAAGQHAILERIDQRSQLASQNIRLTPEGLATTLQDGDIVQLLSVVPRFDKVVTLRGNVADPVRVPWHEGMRISDLIPNKDVLLTRDFWKEHNQLLGGSQAHHDVRADTVNDDSLAALTDTQPEKIRRFTQKNDVQPPAADIDWDYATLERLEQGNLTTRLISFDLGRAVIDHDPGSNLELHPGDIVSVFSNADFATPRSHQTRYVRIEGEVKKAGAYAVQPGETLRDIVARAGGFTANAYVFGAQFTRESTKKEQQLRYSEFLNQLDREISQSSAVLAGRMVSADQMMATQASLNSQRSLVERLRQTPPSGRIVLDLKPESSSLESIPALPLENGDRFFVPASPSTVSVVGTVYNQAAFLFQPEHRVGDYVREAGGPTRYADRARTFIIRADGSVTAKDARTSQFRGNFDSLEMYPGDTIIVPTNVTKTSRVRGFMDWSQVISNFGLGAAAINVLK